MIQRIASRRFALYLTFLVLLAGQSVAYGQGNNSIANVLATDSRLSQMNAAVQSAELTTMFQGAGPYTLFVPSNQAFAAAGGANPNAARQSVLYHTLQGSYGVAALEAKTGMKSALGQDLTFNDWSGLMINGTARVLSADIQTSNGTIHIINQVLSWQDAPTGTGEAAADAAEPVNTLIGHNGGNPSLASATENPAFVSGGLMPYWSGIQADSSSCKGVTWTLRQQDANVANVGSDRSTNPYRGDTECGEKLPLLCIQRDYTQPPSSSYYQGWAYGTIKVTAPIQGYQLKGMGAADLICSQAYGAGWEVVEYHDGNLGLAIGALSGHDVWAFGNLPSGQRFWVTISDQAANPWNSVNPRGTPPNMGGTPVLNVGDAPAFIGDGPLRMTAQQGFAAGRGSCKGMTWVVHRQFNGLVQVGADRSSNPFVGDRDCTQQHRVLCIKVDGYAPPYGSNGVNFSVGWSGGIVRGTPAISGNDINTREKANAFCQQNFGAAYRMADFHTGSMGTFNTDGWEFWAYGSLEPNARYWVAINDQAANVWNK
jgi:hypothetical protein